MKVRKIPLRKCTGCLEMKQKKELVRVVHNENGEFFLDKTGKMQGRGAYICPNSACLERAVKSRGLEKSFKSRVPSEIYERLKSELTDG